jgi:tetratricopeptide (TPR) repeat protein
MSEETEKQIIDELRKQSIMFAEAAKFNKTATFTILILLVVLVVTIPFQDQFISRCMPAPQVVDSWPQARNLIDVGKLTEAEKMLQRLASKYPSCDYGYTLLAHCQLRMGHLIDAEANYAKAYDLFPLEANEKDLAAVRKAIEKKKESAGKGAK